MQKKAAKRLPCRAMSHSPCSWIEKLSQNVIPVFGLHSNPHALKGTLRRVPLTSNSDAENARKGLWKLAFAKQLDQKPLR